MEKSMITQSKVLNYGSFTPTSQERAREIMRHKFFGVEEAIKHFGISPSARELAALAEVPFTEETLAACKDTPHILIAVFPLSILYIRSREDRKLFFGNSHYHHADYLLRKSWYNNYAFAKDCGTTSWHLVRTTIVPDSIQKSWDEQQKLLSKDEVTPSARVVIYTMISKFLSSRGYRRMFKYIVHYGAYPLYVRCSDITSPGCGVAVGGFSYANGIGIQHHGHNGWLSTLGLASERRPDVMA
jgi:hypothetical protein